MKANQLFICVLFILLTASCGSRSGNEFEGVWVGYIPGYTLEYDDTEPAYIPDTYQVFVIEDNVIRHYSMSTKPTSLKEIRGLGEPDEWSKGSYIIEGNTLYKETPINFQLTKEGDVLYDDTIWDDSPTHVKLEKAFSFSKAESKRKDDSKQDEYFEGIVTPGVLVSKFYDNRNAGNLRYTIEQELTIRENHSFEMREKTSGLYGGNVEIRTYEGWIKNKYTENYNGTVHTWYTLEGKMGNWVSSWSIETNGNAVGGLNSTYHEFYTRLNDNRSQGWHWKMTRK